MKKLYTTFLILFSAVLILIFHYSNVKLLWNTNSNTTGDYYQVSFFHSQNSTKTNNLTQVGGKELAATPQQVRYLFNRHPESQIILRPTIREKGAAFFAGTQAYKDLKQLKISKDGSKTYQTLFKVTDGFTNEINLTNFLQDSPSFHLLLDNAENSTDDRVIQGLEVYLLAHNLEQQFPDIMLYALFLIVPLLWLWFFHETFSFKMATALGLSMCCLITLQILSILSSETTEVILYCSGLTCTLLITLDNWLKHKPIPVQPIFWLILLIGIMFRWQEVLIQSAIPLESLQLQHEYFTGAVLMDLFSQQGFYSGLFYHEPLYILMIKFVGQFFGFSAFHFHYVSFMVSILLIWLVMYLGNQIFESPWVGLFSATLLSFNYLFIRESGLGLPLSLEACFFLILIYVGLFQKCSEFSWGIKLGLTGALWCLMHSGFSGLIIFLMLISGIWRMMQEWHWKQTLKGLSIAFSLTAILFLPYLINNAARHEGDAFIENTLYISQVANLEFANKPGFPELEDVIRRRDKAKNYQIINTTDYFFQYHKSEELLAYPFLGYFGISFDVMSALLNTTAPKTYWIEKMLIEHFEVWKSEPILSAAITFEALIFLCIIVFMVWNTSYRILLVMLILAIFPHTFFYGVLLVKGVNVYVLYRYQCLIYILPIFAWVLSAIIVRMGKHHKLLLK